MYLNLKSNLLLLQTTGSYQPVVFLLDYIFVWTIIEKSSVILSEAKDLLEAEKTGDEILLEKIDRLIQDTQSGIEDD